MNDKTLIKVQNVKKIFPIQSGFFSHIKGWARAVDGVDLEIFDGEILALVGESGCGKTTLSRMLLGLLEPSGGRITFLGYDIFDRHISEHKALLQNIQMIFQDVSASLNPRKTVGEILSQPFITHRVIPRKEVISNVIELLNRVEITPAESYIDRYPHEFSGGQKQRIAIARAIALNPRFIIADEPVSGLDMSIRAGILELLKSLRQKFNQTYLFVTHDLAIVRSISNRVAVMYLGRIVELAPTDVLFKQPLHPYTIALLGATPIPDPRAGRQRERPLIIGEVPSCVNVPIGCSFRPRCPLAKEICHENPYLREVAPSHFVSCHLVQG